MHKSQLRKLARQYAQGSLGREAYRRERHDLIKAIVSGATPIEREAPPPPPPVEPDTLPATAPEAARAPVPIALTVGIGIAALVLVAVAAWALWPSGAPHETSPAPAPIAAVPPPVVPKARTLVENFLADKDWSTASIASFKTAWGGLDPGERADARAAPWFHRFSTALRQEINTQKALAEIDDTGAAVAAGTRLVQFGKFLGIGDELPDFPAARASQDGTVPGPGSESTPAQPNAASAAAPPAAGAPSVAAAREPTGSEWLRAQPDAAYTLQLFAVNHLDKVERLIAGHPEIPLRVVAYQGSPRYRVLLGTYASAEAALAGYHGLPEAVRGAQPNPLVKRFDEIRAPAASDGATAAAAASPASPAPVPASDGDWVASQDPGRYTLQLLASDSRENVDRLVASHPELGLRVHLAPDPHSRFRVLYGSFATSEQARAAAAALPSSVIHETGTPLVKSIHDLQAASVR